VKTAQIHRFHDKVAMYLGDGQTVYLKPHDAMVLASKMLECYRDIEARRFRDSTFATFDMELEE
jgi:hypothetical protein